MMKFNITIIIKAFNWQSIYISKILWPLRKSKIMWTIVFASSSQPNSFRDTLPVIMRLEKEVKASTLDCEI